MGEDEGEGEALRKPRHTPKADYTPSVIPAQAGIQALLWHGRLRPATTGIPLFLDTRSAHSLDYSLVKEP